MKINVFHIAIQVPRNEICGSMNSSHILFGSDCAGALQIRIETLIAVFNDGGKYGFINLSDRS